MRPGYRIPLMKPKSIMGAKKGNLLIRVANAFLNMRVRGGKLLIADQNSVLDLDGVFRAIGDATGGETFHPFQIYNPGSDPTIFRIRGGRIQVPELYPADTSARTFGLSTAMSLLRATCTDRLYEDDSTAAAYEGNDLTLADWTGGAGGGPMQACLIYLTVTQSSATPGAPSTAIVAEFQDALTDWNIPAYDINDGLGNNVIKILLGIIWPHNVSGSAPGPWTLTSARFSQCVRSNIVGLFDCTRSQFVYADYEATRVYFPGQMIRWSSTGKTYVLRGNAAYINLAPNVGANWVVLN